MKDCSTCRNFHLIQGYTVCIIEGPLDDVVENCKNYKGPLKCYEIFDKDYLYNNIIVWAETANKARVKAMLYLDCEYINIRTKRLPQYDKYAETKKIPIEELLEDCWYFSCYVCNNHEIDKYDIDDGEAFIIKGNIKDERSFVDGDVVCKRCANKLGLRFKLKILYKNILNIFKKFNQTSLDNFKR